MNKFSVLTFIAIKDNFKKLEILRLFISDNQNLCHDESFFILALADVALFKNGVKH